MSFKKTFWVSVAVVSVALSILFYNLYRGVWSQYSIEQASFVSQLYIGTITVIGIVFTLLWVTYQFGRAIARPQIKLYFDEKKRDSEKIRITGTSSQRLYLPVFVYNDGGAIAESYQIEFEAHEDFTQLYAPSFFDSLESQRIPFWWTPYRKDEGQTATFYSHKRDEYTCFVNRFVSIGMLVLEPQQQKLNELPDGFEKSCKIKYRVFGDWGGEPLAKSLTIELRKP